MTTEGMGTHPEIGKGEPRLASAGSGDAISFAGWLLQRIDNLQTQTTYKYAVLLGLLNICYEASDASGMAPARVLVADLAAAVIEIYWLHTAPSTELPLPIARGEDRPARPPVLHQTRIPKRQAEILSEIENLRGPTRLTLFEARKAAGYEELLRNCSFKLAEMPLPRLASAVGTSPALFTLSWDTNPAPNKPPLKRSAFDALGQSASIELSEGARSNLVALVPLLRPLIQRGWTRMVASIQDNQLADNDLEDFLFAHSRIDLTPVRDPLLRLQGGRCFYCGDLIDGTPDVDHFVPWARWINNRLDNLVIAHKRCNNAKSDHPAAPQYVRKWVHERGPHGTQLEALERLAETLNWPFRPDAGLGGIRSFYLSQSAPLTVWAPRGQVDTGGFRLSTLTERAAAFDESKETRSPDVEA